MLNGQLLIPMFRDSKFQSQVNQKKKLRIQLMTSKFSQEIIKTKFTIIKPSGHLLSQLVNEHPWKKILLTLEWENIIWIIITGKLKDLILNIAMIMNDKFVDIIIYINIKMINFEIFFFKLVILLKFKTIFEYECLIIFFSSHKLSFHK